MAFQKGQGGRPKGVPNKATAEVVALIDGLCGIGAVECFKQLAAIATGQHDNIKARVVANQTLIAYRHGKPRESLDVNLPQPVPLFTLPVDALVKTN